MPGPVVTFGATIMCPHGASVMVAAPNPRVIMSGQPVATMASQFPVTGCPFQIPVGAGTKPQPCIKVLWLVPAVRVLAGGSPVILQTSTGLAQSVEGIPQGPPTVATTQPRVIAT